MAVSEWIFIKLLLWSGRNAHWRKSKANMENKNSSVTEEEGEEDID